ncbi:MAG: hypothetical protein WD898_02355 [Candidatus Paceibacterota bacterium]
MSTIKLYQDAEKYIKDIFWSETHDSHSSLNIPKIVEEKLIADNKVKDPEYFGYREGVVHSTSLAKCLRGVVHEMLGAKKDNEMQPRKLGIFKAGNLFEDFVVEALGDRVIHQQREYEYKYKNITLVGRSDYALDDDGIIRIGENKSVHSDSFWMREKEGTLIAWHNQVQLETYLWLERVLTPYTDKDSKVVLTNVPREGLTPAPHLKLDNPHGIFSYVSKDDCTVIGCPIQFNPHFVDDIIIPALDIINEGYSTKNPEAAPLPPMVVFAEAKHQYQKNWLCTYCEYHSHCAGAGWILEATNLVTTRNKELKAALSNPHAEKKTKPKLEVVGRVEPTTENQPLKL